MVSPLLRRTAVKSLVDQGKCSQRCACRLVNISRSVAAYTCKRADEEKELISYMINLDDPIIHRRDYQRYAGLSKASVNRLFSGLEQRGYLTQRGVGRGTFYTISLRRVLEDKEQ